MEPTSLSEKVGFWVNRLDRFVSGEILTPAHLAQAPAIMVTLLAASIIARVAEPLLRRLLAGVAVDRMQEEFYLNNILPLSLPAIWTIGLWCTSVAADRFGWPNDLVIIAIKLAVAWLIIRFASAMLNSAILGRIVAILVWTLAALSIVGVLEPLLGELEAIRFTLGGQRVSVLAVLEGLLTMVILMWLSIVIGRFVARRIENVTELTPSARVLFGKVSTIVLISIAFVLSLGVVGIDLTALAVFTGAVGVGVGFGLQKSVANLFAGIILLLDKSIKPGDIIEVGGTYGWVSALGARYVEVETRDGTQFLIPNEDIITQRVFNWTHQHDQVRLKVRVRVAYGTDLRQALKLMREAGGRQTRVLKVPAPNPVLLGFGENGADLELRFWIADVQNGVHNISSDVMLAIWDLFCEHGIQVPLPQRVVRMIDRETGTPEDQATAATRPPSEAAPGQGSGS
ncbi:MAG: mechanosensitive ion channel [Rhodospirillales bacterium]|nr:mechanosensitive ion channel [Rhodospirillales bacterium]